MNAIFIQDANALVRQREADTYLPEHQFSDAAQAIAFAKAASAGAFSEAHQIEIDGEPIERIQHHSLQCGDIPNPMVDANGPTAQPTH